MVVQVETKRQSSVSTRLVNQTKQNTTKYNSPLTNERNDFKFELAEGVLASVSSKLIQQLIRKSNQVSSDKFNGPTNKKQQQSQ